MGLRGPKPVPTQWKRVRGNPGKRRLPEAEPELGAPESLVVPAGLEGAGRREWERLAEPLAQSGVLTVADLGSFEDYCRALTELRTFEAKARKARPEAAILKGYQGMVIKLRAQVAQLRGHLGLTPSSRSGVVAKPPRQENDPFEKFLGESKLRRFVGGRAS